MHCLTCHYDLRKLAELRCPECGRAFDPSDSITFRDPAERNRRIRQICGICLLCMVAVLSMLLLSWLLKVSVERVNSTDLRG